MPPFLRAALTSQTASDEWAPFTAATAYARAGFRVLPVETGGKEPATVGPFAHGAHSARADVECIRETWLAQPAANVGLAPDRSYIIIDVDPKHGGSLDIVEDLGLPVHGYRERSPSGGWHLPLVMPPGIRATSGFNPVPGIELIGVGRYAVSPPSRLEDGSVYRVDDGRDVWFWPAIPATWRYLHRLARERPEVEPLRWTEADDGEADRVARLMAKGRYGADVCTWMAGRKPERFRSRSEADRSMAGQAVYYVRNHPQRAEVVAALLWRFSRKRLDHPNPHYYVRQLVASALAWRDQHEPDARILVRLARGTQLLNSVASSDIGAISAAGRRSPPEVRSKAAAFIPESPVHCSSHTPGMYLDGTPHSLNPVDVALLAFLGAGGVDVFTGFDDWVRVPVEHIATVLGVNRRTVARRLAALRKVGAIEREVHRSDSGGMWKAESWARVAQTGDA